MSATRSRQPWSMKWIVFAILVVIIPYTFLTIRFRKSGKSFEPYQDMKERATTVRLLSAGFQRITLVAERPADSDRRTAPGAIVTKIAGGIPNALNDSLIDRPVLPSEITQVVAAPAATTMLPYTIDVSCTQPDYKEQFGGAEAYVQGDQIWIAPELEKLSGELLSRVREITVRLTFPPGSLKSGNYQVTALGAKASRTWTLQVK